MCGKRIKIGLSVLLVLLLLLPHGISLAATITESEIQTLSNNSKRLAEINSYLQLNSTDSQKTLLKVSEELRQSKLELEMLKQELVKLQANLQIAKSLSQSQQDLLQKTNESFQQFSKEQKAIQNKLKVERTIWQVITGVAIYFAVTK